MRVATFNLENLDAGGDEDQPELEERIALMRPQILRLEADVLCLQEIHGQGEGGDRRLSALDALLEGTPYAEYNRVTTTLEDSDQPYAERNLVTLSRYEVKSSRQYKHDFAPAPVYRPVTAVPEEEAAKLTWERPILRATLELPDGNPVDVLNLHLKSKNPTAVAGQKKDPYTWKSASGWAEGFFISSLKRVGQALEVRMLIDQLLDEDEGARILTAGDFNAKLDEVPLQAITGPVERTGNGELAWRVMIPCEKSVPEPERYSLIYQGEGEMIDHILMSRSLLAFYKDAEVHNELLHDESIAYATDLKYPESDHAPVVATFDLDPGFE